MYGEKVEEAEELKLDLQDVKVNLIQKGGFELYFWIPLMKFNSIIS